MIMTMFLFISYRAYNIINPIILIVTDDRIRPIDKSLAPIPKNK